MAIKFVCLTCKLNKKLLRWLKPYTEPDPQYAPYPRQERKKSKVYVITLEE